MKLYILRHGETAWNRERRLQGRADVPLNEQGMRLAAKTGAALSEVPFDLCIASPLIRTRQTALFFLNENKSFQEKRKDYVKASPEQLFRAEGFLPLSEGLSADGTFRAAASAAGFPLLYDGRIAEIAFGVWEGLGCGPDNMEVPYEEFRFFFTEPERLSLPEGAESVEAVKRRTAAFLADLSGRSALSGKTILIATHGCTLRALLNPFYEDPGNFWQEHVPYNCAVNVLETDADGVLRHTAKDLIFYDPSAAANYAAK